MADTTWVTLVLQRLAVRRCLGTPKPTPKPRVEGISQWNYWGHVLHASGRREDGGFRKGFLGGIDDHSFFLELSKYQMGKGKQKHHLHLQVIVLLIYIYIYIDIYHPICFLLNKLGKPCFFDYPLSWLQRSQAKASFATIYWKGRQPKSTSRCWQLKHCLCSPPIQGVSWSNLTS